jgi:3'-phosphoadenosine 5'-phosphosulfate sulfotransferase (PAPS reductase)/FAD synthetase
VQSDALFTAADVYAGDPLRPGLNDPTPAEIVAGLPPADRVQRVKWLTLQANAILDYAIREHANRRTVVAYCVLFSGGDDSTTLAHMMRGRATHAIHANTTIGIEETRQYVRDTCAGWGLPLIEKVAPVSYRELVLDQGFPGPGMHWKMYSRLKERCLDAARHDLGVANSRTKCAVYIAGRRRAESERREDIPLHESDGSVIWASPLAMWTKLDLATYRTMHPDCPRNPVSAQLHMSGECLCGAFAHPGELDEIGYWFPDVKAEIEALQCEVAAAGFAEPLCTWGHGQGVPSKRGRLCSSCLIPQDTLDLDLGSVA